MALTKVTQQVSSTPGISDSSNATAITIDSSERVMIGTTDAGYPDYGDSLTLGDVDGGGGNAGMTIRSGTSSYGTFYFSDDTGTAAGTYAGKMQYNHSNNSMVFATNSTDRLTIDSSGNVGIGITSPDQKLMVKGTIETEATNSTNGWHIYTYTDNTLRFNYNGSGSDELIIDSSGNHTRTSHPIFMANEPASTAGDANNVIIFGAEDHDQGGHYNTSNGRFTAPINGRYFFTVSVLFDPDNTGNSHYARLTFRVNGTGSTKYAESLNSAFSTDAGSNSTTSNYQSLSMSTIITLAANDFVDVTNSGTMPTYGTNYGSFAGFLVG